jgi:hypothetical protein
MIRRRNRVTSRDNVCATILLSQAVDLAIPVGQSTGESTALRHQLMVLQRKVRGLVEFTNGDRLFFILLYRWFPSILREITIFWPETLARWHWTGFRRYWCWGVSEPGRSTANQFGIACVGPAAKH